MAIAAHIIYLLLWLSFGVMHSVLASPSVRAILQPLFGRGLRLAYNLFAAVHIGLVIYGGRYLLGGDAVSLNLSALTEQVLSGLMLLGAAIGLAALTQYDLGRFAGITQLLKPAGEDVEEPLHLGGLHRFVRHPLYSGVYLYLWGSVRSEFDLLTALYASAYLMIGSHFEERKLIDSHGDAYRRYKRQVPAVIPWRGRVL